MEKDEFIPIASIEQHEGWLIDIEENLEPQLECCIYKVPKYLRKINENAYTPQVISIGPLYYGEKQLSDMEKQKIRLKREFSERITPEKLQEFINFIEMHEQYIRNCYQDFFIFEKLEFIRKILYDSIFILELFLRRHERKSEFLLDNPRLKEIIRLDLQLLENQLPYFILNKLYILAFPKPEPRGQSHPSFFSLSYMFFYDSMFRGSPPKEMEVKHFVDLRRCVLTKRLPQSYRKGFPIELPSVLKLQEYGVKFRCIRGHGLLDVEFEKKKLRIPWLPVHKELKMPELKVGDTTECLIRNVTALEQCHYPSETHVCNYIALMDYLINTEEDVNLLVEAGIISNYKGDNARIVKMFNELRLNNYLSWPSCYNDIVKDLQEHYKNPWNRAIVNIKRVYFRNWRVTGTIAALMLLFLTLIQALCSIMQVVNE